MRFSLLLALRCLARDHRQRSIARVPVASTGGMWHAWLKPRQAYCILQHSSSQLHIGALPGVLTWLLRHAVLCQVAAVDEPKLHLWETGVMRITRHPQMLGQLIW